MSDAERWRAGIPWSTDPARLEREARRIEEKAMTMLEKAARAIFDSDPAANGLRYDEHKEDWIEMARAMLRAIREPDEATLKAGFSENNHWERRAPEDVWPAMIDSILAGNTEKADPQPPGAGAGTAGNITTGPGGSRADTFEGEKS